MRFVGIVRRIELDDRVAIGELWIGNDRREFANLRNRDAGLHQPLEPCTGLVAPESTRQQRVDGGRVRDARIGGRRIADRCIDPCSRAPRTVSAPAALSTRRPGCVHPPSRRRWPSAAVSAIDCRTVRAERRGRGTRSPVAPASRSRCPSSQRRDADLRQWRCRRYSAALIANAAFNAVAMSTGM